MSRDYRAMAQADAWETAEGFVDQMVEQWRDDGWVSDDLNNDYSGGDEYHHETHCQGDYTLREAATLLEELAEWEEMEAGLWQGLDPRRAISTKAVYTYGQAVWSMWSDLVEVVNYHLDELRSTLEVEGGPEGDRLEAQVVTAGEWLIRLWVLFGDDPHTDYDGMVGAAWAGVLVGDRTAALVLADKVQEGGEDRLAQQIREAVSAEVPEVEAE